VFGIYAGIKKRYKNVKAVLENPIQIWDLKEKKNTKYTERQYKNTFGAQDLNTLDKQLFRNGVNVKDLNKNN